ncbi:hypothetical protein [Amycolatopsis granulosa]|uniref:hypothetical protein n=1 Tax=Amycolatopsis granulosa TaxID=185684 RepID=UPI001422F895|nr:hypothetical protein [Amycolatopsis granulosa]NIH87013.1 hypothetical protein [Amycolatopsis granulosa]
MNEGDRAPTIGPTAGAGLTAVGGAGYDFDPDQIAELIPKWEELRVGITQDQERLRVALRETTAPSADEPAQANALRIAASIQAAIDHNAILLDYAQSWIYMLKRANGTYQSQDDHTRSVLNRASGAADGSGLYE